MKKRQNIFRIAAFFAGLFLLSSCFKEDEKMPPLPLETITTPVGNLYETQVFFDLNTFESRSSNLIDTWDLAFDCSDSSWTVKLNSALMMYAGNAQTTNFESVITADGLAMSFDASSGNNDSTAIGTWIEKVGGTMQSKKQVYVIDRGLDSQFHPQGFKKIILDWVDNKYQITWANLDGSGEQTVTLEKNPMFNFMFLSFDDGIVSVEPEKQDWSLKFSRYSTVLFTDVGDPYDYNLVGVLSNPYQVTVAETADNFESISIADTSKYIFSTQADIIGYDWKLYDFDGGNYTIVADKNYVIKNNDGFFYKLQFISFYDNQGNKGAMTYYVKRL
jgi:hypothetical protein